MKKTLITLLVLVVAFVAFANGSTEAASSSDKMAIAMVTDYGDITDQSFNQTTYEACRDWASANDTKFNYYKPSGDSDAARIEMIEKAIDDGFNVIVMPGYAFAGAVVNAAPRYKDVKFIVLDMAKGDLLSAALGDKYDWNPDNWDIKSVVDLSNCYCIVYQEEIAGYLAGYATVALGYTKLGYCGGMAVPAVIRYGLGYVQGAEAAAKAKGKKLDIQYAYAGQFFGDADVTAAMDTMYKNGAQAVFACGGLVCTSVCEAAKKVNGMVLGVDVDQSGSFNSAYGYNMTVTSAMKGLRASTLDALSQIKNGTWANIAGTIANLGLVSGTDMDSNFVGIPKDGTLWSSAFTYDDYVALVGKIYNGSVKVSNDSSNPDPSAFSKSVSSYIASIK